MLEKKKRLIKKKTAAFSEKAAGTGGYLHMQGFRRGPRVPVFPLYNVGCGDSREVANTDIISVVKLLIVAGGNYF